MLLNMSATRGTSLNLTPKTIDPLASRSVIDAMAGVAVQAREDGIDQQRRIQVIYEALIKAPVENAETMIHRLATLSAVLLDDLAAAQSDRQGDHQ
jgi:hypothetical protein